MLRQFLVFYKGDIIFSHSFAIGLDIEELNKAKETMQTISVPDKTVSRPILNYQIFHYLKTSIQFSYITDCNDSYNYIDKIMKKTISKFSLFFPDPLDIKDQFSSKEAFVKFLYEAQKELHTKIALIGPLNAGKTTCYNLIRNDDEHSIMNVAKSSTTSIGDLTFDIWDSILTDNFSLLWSKLIGGSDLVIFIFDASNYNLQVLNHFINLYKKESGSAKLIVIANKSDLISKDDIKRIKTELDNIEIKELSLIKSNGKSRIYRYISDTLKLKKNLPSNFENLIKQAENLEESGNTVAAIAKYKELINICNTYQELDLENEFKEKCEQLDLKLKKNIAERKEEQKKIKFTPSHAIKFSEKIMVKKLPSMQKSATSETLFAQNKIKAELDNSIKNASIGTKKKKVKKLSLKPGDIKINLQNIKSQAKLINGLGTTSSTKSKSDSVPNLEIDPNKLKTDQDYAEALQTIIKKEGSELTLELCLEFIDQMKNELKRNLTFDDLLIAKDAFIKQE